MAREGIKTGRKVTPAPIKEAEKLVKQLVEASDFKNEAKRLYKARELDKGGSLEIQDTEFYWDYVDTEGTITSMSGVEVAEDEYVIASIDETQTHISLDIVDERSAFESLVDAMQTVGEEETRSNLSICNFELNPGARIKFAGNKMTVIETSDSKVLVNYKVGDDEREHWIDRDTILERGELIGEEVF